MSSSVDTEPPSTGTGSPSTGAGTRPARRRRAPASSAAVSSTTPVPPRLPGRRNPRWIAFGVLALCLGGLLAYAVYSRVTTETSVLALASTVYRGEVVEAADLTTVTLHGNLPASVVLAADEPELIGKRAVFDLPQGSLIGPASVADDVVPAAGSAVVGLRLATGRAPAGLLVPSAPVRVVALPAATGATAGDGLTGKTYLAHIVDQAPGPDGTSVVVDLEVAAEQAPTIALLGAQERVALVRDAGR